MKTISLDLRERILAVYDAGKVSREEVGQRFRVSVGMVKKLIQQRRHTGEIGPRHYRSGRKRSITSEQRQSLRQLVTRKPDLTLEQMRAALSLKCSLPALHYILVQFGLTYKKRRSAQPNNSAPTSSKRGGVGRSSKAVLIRQSLSSSMSRRRKPI